MCKIKKIVILFLFLSLLFANESFKYIGKLKPIWKYQPVVGFWLVKGQGIIKVPKYMYKISFPYKPNINIKEVPFAKSLNIVRLLGGYDYKKFKIVNPEKYDLIYLKGNKYYYNWKLLKERLNPYISIGYKDLTLVLDNIPWDLADNPQLGVYGQKNPPKDFILWQSFIENLVKHLIDFYGYNIVKNFRFRIGTEFQHKKRFNGTLAQYVKLYLTSQKAILKYLPNAKIGLFNFGGGKKDFSKTNINIEKLIELSNKNILKIDFIPISFYLILKKQNNMNIYKKIKNLLKTYKYFYKRLVKISNKKFSKEVHEFGILNNISSIYKSNEPGVLGASIRMYALFDFFENNITRVYHWTTFEKVAGHYILKGNGWNYSVLDYLVGSDVYTFPEKVTNDYVLKYMLFKKENSIYVLFTIFPRILNTKQFSRKKKLSLKVPKKFFLDKSINKIGWVYLNKNTSALDKMVIDLKERNYLKLNVVENNYFIGKIWKMANISGKKYLKHNIIKYEKIIIDSLTLKKFNGKMKLYKDYYSLSFDVNIPYVGLIKIDFQ